MKLSRPTSWVVAALVAWSVSGADAKRAKASLRVVPQIGSPSTSFLFVADLKGGADTEDLHCLIAEWDWGSQDTSVQESECSPFQPGATRIERRYSTTRTFSTEGVRTVTLFLRKGNKLVARDSISFRVTWEKKPPTASFRDPRP